MATSDGSVKALATELSRNPGINAGYPARFQIPPRILWGLDEAEKVQRAEMFAMASFLYEIFSGTQIFEGLSDDKVQDRFSNREFPDNAISLPSSLNIRYLPLNNPPEYPWSYRRATGTKRKIRSR